MLLTSMIEFIFSFIKNIRVKLHPSLLVSCAGAVAIDIETTSFSSTNKANLLSPSWNCDKQMVLAKRVIKLPNLRLLIKQRSLTGDCFCSFWQITKGTPRKSKCKVSLLFNGPETIAPASSKVKLFAKFFSENYNIDVLRRFLLTFPSGSNLKHHNITITSKNNQKTATVLDSFMAPGPQLYFNGGSEEPVVDAARLTGWAKPGEIWQLNIWIWVL